MTYSSDFTPNVTEFDVEIYSIALELDVDPDKAWEFAVEVCEVDKEEKNRGIMGLLTVICILLKGCLEDIMTLLQFLGFSFVSSVLKLAWCFYNDEQKEATLQMIEEEIFITLLEGKNEQLAREMQVLYTWLLVSY